MSNGSRLLLDTHAFLWLTSDPERLGPSALSALAEPTAELFLSTASVWEISIKVSIGKLELDDAIDRFLDEQLTAARIRVLDVRLAETKRVATLPMRHRDPFDRLLAAQALIEDVPIVSRDVCFDAYGVTRVWS